MAPIKLTLATLATCAVGALAAQNQLVQVTNFGSNPTNVKIYTYRPNGLVANPALIVAMHYCTGTAQAYFTGTQYANLADNYKSFMIIYPSAPDSGGCWDVHSTETLTHDRGGDSLGIASAVRYAIQNYGVPKNKVFMTGSSSGAMMTNVLAGAYPDLFVAGAAFAGVPYACFAGSGMWNSQCAQGQSSKTAQQWVRRQPIRAVDNPQNRWLFYRETSFAVVIRAIQASVPACRSGTEPSNVALADLANPSDASV